MRRFASRLMMTSARAVWPIGCVLCLCLVGVGCGSGWLALEDSGGQIGDGGGEAVAVSGAVSPDEPVAPPPPPTRCERACRHIMNLSAPSAGEDAQATWMPECLDRCEEHGSKGQIECYERARTAAELQLCVVD